MLKFSSFFAGGFSYDEFLAKYATTDQAAGWSRRFDTINLTGDQQNLLAGFTREIRVLCMAGAWCGDCVQQCPIFKRFADHSPKIKLRFVDRDFSEELKAGLTICGGARVPQVVFLSEEDKPVGWYGDRTLAKYRSMAESQFGDASIGNADSSSDLETSVIQQWLDEFERIQLILRLSPGLRQKHGD